jgi:hypothetical protein
MDINELTYQIRGAVFEVNRVLGAGDTGAERGSIFS